MIKIKIRIVNTLSKQLKFNQQLLDSQYYSFSMLSNKSLLLLALISLKVLSFQMQNAQQSIAHSGIALQALESQDSQIFISNVQSISLRLHPGQDIMTSLTKLLIPLKLSAVSISTAVGSVRYCWLRLANNSFLSKVQGPFQITSLVGTFDKNMKPHVHIQLANGNGDSVGGHLPSPDERYSANQSYIQEQQMQNISNSLGLTYDCPIFTTLELALLSHNKIVYERKIDPETTFHELYISKKKTLF